jgi:hypothetical protein
MLTASAPGRDQFGMNAIDRFDLFVELGPRPKGSCISQPDPELSDVGEDLATCWIVRGSQSVLALGRSFPRIYLKHRSLPFEGDLTLDFHRN